MKVNLQVKGDIQPQPVPAVNLSLEKRADGSVDLMANGFYLLGITEDGVVLYRGLDTIALGLPTDNKGRLLLMSNS